MFSKCSGGVLIVSHCGACGIPCPISGLLFFQALATGREFQASEGPWSCFVAVCPAWGGEDTLRWQGSAVSHTPQHHTHGSITHHSTTVGSTLGKAPEAAGVGVGLLLPFGNQSWALIIFRLK